MVGQIAVIGAGAMGRGIAQIAIQAGVRTQLFDANTEALKSAQSFIQAQLNRLVEKGKLTAEACEQALSRLELATGLEDMTRAEVVIEAIVENLDAKRDLFVKLEAIVATNCILATNTSSLSVTSIQKTLKHPERVGGLHFFNPVPLMKVAEVIPGLLTNSLTTETLTSFTKACGHRAVLAQDTPGFIVNHAGRAFGTEALRIIGEGIADVATVDSVLKDCVGFRLGPFELMDLTGLDVSHAVMESIYARYYHEPRYRPSATARLRVEAGLLGRKSTRGFYDYRDGKDGKGEPAVLPVHSSDLPKSVWISRSGMARYDDLALIAKNAGVSIDGGDRPSVDALIVVQPLGDDATTSALKENLDPKRLVAIDMFGDFAKRRTLMITPITEKRFVDQACALFGTAPVSIINDSPGFIAQRVVAAIVNIGSDMAQQQITSPDDLDAAVSLGLGYPKGPLAMGDHFGARHILTILENMYSFYGDPRYRPSPWLKRRALLGMTLK